MARRLKPHNKSSANLHRHGEKPEPMTSISDKHHKKQKPQKWQFGIRSRNTPCEAMLAIYKALHKMGAEWEVPKAKEPGVSGSGEASPERNQRDGSHSPEYSDSDPEPGTDPEYATHSDQERRRRRRAEREGGDGRRGRDRFGRWNDYGYTIPEDPWVIHARFKKEGMYPPGVAHPSSTHSSRVDLNDGFRRRSSAVSSAAVSTAGSSENVAASGPPSASGDPHHPNAFGTGWPKSDESVWVYVTIQLYSIEKDFFLVDFKCAGYERLVKRFAREMSGSNESDIVRVDNAPEGYNTEEDGTESRDGEELVGAGRSAEEKDISSPFPFLDVSGRLIIQLAEAQD